MESDFSRFSDESDFTEKENTTMHKEIIGNVEVECVFGDIKIEKMLDDLINK